MSSKDFKISVVTINKNNAAGLLATLQSVQCQVGVTWEQLVVDGKSDDGSIEVIGENSVQIAWWISEEDNGVYDAQNKGLLHASGDYCIFLNSGDRFAHPRVLEKLARATKKGNEVVFGDLWIEAFNGSPWLKQYPDTLPANFFDVDTLPHPATLIPTRLLKKLGGYDSSLQICADWKFFREVFIRKIAPFVHVPEPVAFFSAGGISSTNPTLLEEEKTKVKLEQPYVKLQRPAWKKWLKIS